MFELTRCRYYIKALLLLVSIRRLCCCRVTQKVFWPRSGSSLLSHPKLNWKNLGELELECLLQHRWLLLRVIVSIDWRALMLSRGTPQELLDLSFQGKNQDYMLSSLRALLFHKSQRLTYYLLESWSGCWCCQSLKMVPLLYYRAFLWWAWLPLIRSSPVLCQQNRKHS